MHIILPALIIVAAAFLGGVILAADAKKDAELLEADVKARLAEIKAKLHADETKVDNKVDQIKKDL
jgi:sensor domain CHASE-containing protein